MARRDHQNPYTRFKRGEKPDYANAIVIPPEWGAWVKTFRNQFVRILARPKLEEQTPKIVLYITIPGQRGLAISLTDLTVKELSAIKVFLNETIDLALPICEVRDGVSNDLVNQGLDDTDNRVDRIFPEVVTRAWARGIDGDSVFQRLAYIPNANGAGEPSGGEPGGDQPGVAERNTGAVSPPNDLEAIDLN